MTFSTQLNIVVDKMRPSRGKLTLSGEITAVFIFFISIYTYTLCGVSAASHDSIFYIIRIDAARHLIYSHNNLFHPHHLVYNAIAANWVSFFRYSGLSNDAAFLVSLFNAVLGVLALCVFYAILRNRLFINYWPAFTGTSLLAFSYGFWFYSVSVEVCVPPYFFLLLCVYLLSADNINEKTYLIAGILNGIAVIFHQSHILFAPVILLSACDSYKHHGLDIKKTILFYLSAFVLIVGSAYLIVMTGPIGITSIKEGWAWLSGYTKNKAYWNPPALSTFGKVGIGFSRAVIGYYFIFAIPFFRALADKALANNWLRDEVFLVRGLSANTAYLLLGLSLILGLLLLIYLALYRRNWKELRQKRHSLFSMVVTWFATYTVFNFFWVANNAEFWIPNTICAWLLLAGIYAPGRGITAVINRRFIPITVAILLLMVNYQGSINFLKDNNNDFYFNKSAPLAAISQKGDLIVIGPSVKISGKASGSWNYWTLHSYLLNYTEANIVNPFKPFEDSGRKHFPDKLIQLTHKHIDTTLRQGGKVLIFQEAVDPRFFKDNPTVIEKIWGVYKDKWRKVEVGINTLYLLEPDNL